MRAQVLARYLLRTGPRDGRWSPFCTDELTNMWKSRQHFENVSKFRERMKHKLSTGRASSSASLQVIGSGAPGEPRCVCLSTDSTRYVFNCGEGTQRLSNEHKIKLSKMKHIFVTSATWRNLGGLPGMLLTLQDVGAPSISLRAPEGTSDIFKAISKFVYLETLEMEHAGTSDYEDSTVKISCVPISKYPRESQNTERSLSSSSVERTEKETEKETQKGPERETESGSTDRLESDERVNANGKRSKEEERVDDKKRAMTKEDKRISSVVAYVCKLPGMTGTLLLEKCVEMGVTPGPQLGQLKEGKDVTLDDGTVVRSKDVCSPKTPDMCFLVVECPSEEYLENFVSNATLAKHQASASVREERASVVVHFTPEGVFNHPRYREWMEGFASSTRHVVVNEGNRCLGSERVHRMQHQLHLLHPEIFPFLNEAGFKDEKKEGEHPLIHRALTCHEVNLRRNCYLDTSKEVVLYPQDYVKELFEVNGFLDALAELQTELNARTKLLDTAEYPKIVMLGTGSSIPSKTRNTSAIMLWIDEKHSMLLDCGEGTSMQIRRFYGDQKFEEVLNTIKAIYISHVHADHHLGLVEVLQERARVTSEPVHVLLPTVLLPWLTFYDVRFEPIVHAMRPVNNRQLIFDDRQIAPQIASMIHEAVNVRRIETVYVDHCPQSYGVAVTLNNGRKIVYSGDTRPSSRLVDLGLDCDVLIHEATMEDTLEDEAHAKQHSTTSQAIRIGQSMRAKHVLLTHFSQRYSKIPHLPTERQDVSLENVGIAYDNMCVSLSQLPLLPLFYPTLKVMYYEHYLRTEKKTGRRAGQLPL